MVDEALVGDGEHEAAYGGDEGRAADLVDPRRGEPRVAYRL